MSARSWGAKTFLGAGACPNCAAAGRATIRIKTGKARSLRMDTVISSIYLSLQCFYRLPGRRNIVSAARKSFCRNALRNQQLHAILEAHLKQFLIFDL